MNPFPESNEAVILDDASAEAVEDLEESQRLLEESYRKTLPVNVMWTIATGLGISVILYAGIAALRNRRAISAREMPYFGLLLSNLFVLLVVEIPDIIIFTTGEAVHNDWTKFAYDSLNNLPLFNLAWIGIQSWIQASLPDWISVKKSLALGGLIWFMGVALALPISVSFTLIEDSDEYMSKYAPLFLISFMLQKAFPLMVAVVSSLIASIIISSRISEDGDCKEKSCCWGLFERSIRGYIFDMIAIIVYTLVWISEDAHVMVYLFNGYAINY